MRLEKFYSESPTWHRKIGDIHALLERVKISEERSGGSLGRYIDTATETVADVGVNVGANVGVNHSIGSDKAGHWEVVEKRP